MVDMKKNCNQLAGQRKVGVRGACREARQVGTRRSAGIAVKIVGSLAAMACPVFVWAAEWTLQPSVAVAVGRDDNPTLSPGVSRSVNSTHIAPQLRVDGTTETSEIKLNLAANATKYSDEGIDDTQEQSLTLSSFNRATERSRVGLDAELRREILYDYVAQESGTGDLRNVDVGLVRTEVRRDGLVASPSWNYALSELSSVRLKYRADDVGYTNTVSNNLVDYKQQDISVEYIGRVTIQDNLSLLVATSAYRPDVGGHESDTSRLFVGWSRAFSETANGRLFFGPSRTTEKSAAGEETSSGFAVEVGATQRSELTTLDTVVSRDIQPSGAGRSVESTQLRLNYGLKLSPHTELVMRARTFRNEVLEGSDPAVDRRYTELAPEFRWQLAPEWFVSAAYIFRKQKFDAEPNSAESKAVFIALAFVSRRLGASR